MSENPSSDDNPSPDIPPTVAFTKLVSILSDASRWRMLRALAGGETLMVSELAEIVETSFDSASKHMSVLREAGIAIQGRNRCYRLHPQFLVDKSQRLVDFG